MRARDLLQMLSMLLVYQPEVTVQPHIQIVSDFTRTYAKQSSHGLTNIRKVLYHNGADKGSKIQESGARKDRQRFVLLNL